MTTPYCSRDTWAEKQGKTDWATFSASESWPQEDQLQDALEDATEIMNDMEHIGCMATNISDSNYTPRLERICYNMANRILDVENARGLQGGGFGMQQWSQADYLMSYERNYLVRLSIIKGYRLYGKVG